MSATIYIELELAIKEIRPDLLGEFKQCKDKPTIIRFLNANFPLMNQVEPPDWGAQLMTKAPDMLRQGIGSQKNVSSSS